MKVISKHVSETTEVVGETTVNPVADDRPLFTGLRMTCVCFI